jgi:hypothetical protein
LAADAGFGMAPLIKARPGFGKKLVAPFDVETGPAETIYLVSRAEPARDRRMPRSGDGSWMPSTAPARNNFENSQP